MPSASTRAGGAGGTVGAGAVQPSAAQEAATALSASERAYREAKLRDIERRIRQDGPHVARPHPNRAKQFMPFAALKGYRRLLAEKETESICRPQT